MKKICTLSVSLLLYCSFLQAQGIYQLWGMSKSGGTDDAGAMFSVGPTGNNFLLRNQFTYVYPGAQPKYTEPIAYNGKLYGMTRMGGRNYAGVIYEYIPATNTYTRKIDLATATGSFPEGSLTLYNGKFYGMTIRGGANDAGVIFEWDPTTNIYTKKIDFNYTNGSSPSGSMVVSNGKFYGMTYSGGGNSNGVIFEWDPATNIYTKKIDLGTAIGYRPYGDLSFYGGKFYGMTSYGGTTGYGVIFEWDPLTNIFTTKINLASATGNNPIGSMVLYGGKFYGFAGNGGNGLGVIFEWDPATNIYIKKFDFNSPNGYNPTGNLRLNGTKFYGLTAQGGNGGYGTLFEWDPATNIYTNKITLTNATGSYPAGTLGQLNGKFYGMTYAGGTNGQGVLFEWDPAVNVYTKKLDFNYSNGLVPEGDLTYYAGKLYGLTTSGGIFNHGVIFEFDPAANTYTKKIDLGTNVFSSFVAYGNLTLNNGKFYGMSYYGGTGGQGVLFEWDPNTNVYTDKFNLDNSTGQFPYGSMTALNGKLYGMTSGGGANNLGVIFEWDPATNIYTTKFDFTNLSGHTPRRDLIYYGTKFYGMTSAGGGSAGVIFEWDPVTNIYTVKKILNSTDGGGPFGNLVLSGNKFYGLAHADGGSNNGVIFEWDPATGIYTRKITINTVNGSVPVGTPLLSSGKFYGMTRDGGTANLGVIYEWSPTTNVYTKKKDFLGTDGKSPISSSLITVPALIANGVAGTCTALPTVTINSTNNNVWVPITDNTGAAVAEIKANGNNLGVISTSVYINGGPVRQDGANRLYLDRNLLITPAVQPNPAIPVDIRLYLKRSEFERLQTAVNSLGQPSGINTINDVNFFKNNDACLGAVTNSASPVTVTGAPWGENYVLTASINSFSSFYIANKNNAALILPLTLLNFSGKADKADGKLYWTTENEINTASFDIERSINGINFRSISSVTASNIPGVHAYNYTDKDAVVSSLIYYYRLKQTDLNGSFKYSNVVKLSFSDKKNIVIFPNPVAGEINFTISTAQREEVTGRIIDNAGKTVKMQKWDLKSGSNIITLDVSALVPGIFYMELKGIYTDERTQFIKK